MLSPYLLNLIQPNVLSDVLTQSTFLDMVNPQEINKGKLYKWTCDQTIITTWTEIGHTVSVKV